MISILRVSAACSVLALGLSPSPSTAQSAREHTRLEDSLPAWRGQRLAEAGAVTRPGQAVRPSGVRWEPCPEPTGDAGIAAMRPIGIVSRAAWELWAWSELSALARNPARFKPFDICFRRNERRPDRSFHNLVQWNSDFHKKLQPNTAYLLPAYALRPEPLTFAEERARNIQQSSDSEVQRLLIPCTKSDSRSSQRATARRLLAPTCAQHDPTEYGKIWVSYEAAPPTSYEAAPPTRNRATRGRP